MAKQVFNHIFDGSFLSVAQLTVISFVLMSIIGGGILWTTEHSRVVHAKIPIHKNVMVTEKNQNGDLVIQPQEQIHTFPTDTTYRGEKFIDTLFTAVSALCVTGLTSTDFSSFTLTGQIVTVILIQMGGLGIILFTSLFAMAISRGVSEQASFRKLLSGVLDTQEDYVRNMIRHVITYTFLFEGLATIIMAIHLQFGVDKSLLSGINPWWWALFHSVSAFNNAGFGLLNNNLSRFVTDPIINLTIAALIILGGLGYPVLIGIHIFFRGSVLGRKDTEQHHLLSDMRRVAASSVQIQVALVGTLLLLLVGTIFPFLEELKGAFSGYSFSDQILIMFFQSVSTRTAGFNTIDIGSMGVATLFLYMILMYIGANPAGTAGGIKIPTVAVLFGYLKDWFQNPGLPVTLMGKPVSKFALSHAIRLFFLSICTIAGVTFIICFIEGKWLITPDPVFSFLKVIFEVFSAFGTVGLSMGFTGGVTSFSALLTPGSKLLIIITMLIGRLGPLTILASLPWKKEPSPDELTLDYPDAQRIQIG